MIPRSVDFLKAHEHGISALTCIVGFALDSWALPSIDHTITLVVCVAYFTTAITLLFLSQAIAGEKIRQGLLVRGATLYPLVMQFLFGGLFSVVFVYYFRSSSLAVSWPLTILLALFLAGNEIWKKRLEKLEFQIGVLFILFLFFSIFSVPLLFGTIGTAIFLFSVGFSIVMMGILLAMLASVAWGELKENALKLFFMLSFSALVVVGFYAVDILPPIPLVTRTDGVYHSLSRDTSGEYVASSEKLSVKQKYFPYLYPAVYHRTPDEPVYFYSAVYAPTVLHAPIVHLWQYRDMDSRSWVTSSRIEFPINGGREEGYRGYSVKQNTTAGLWRVLVQTEDGRTLSRRTFTIVDVVTPSDTTTGTL